MTRKTENFITKNVEQFSEYEGCVQLDVEQSNYVIFYGMKMNCCTISVKSQS